MDEHDHTLPMRGWLIANLVMLLDVLVATVAGFFWPVVHWVALTLVVPALVFNLVTCSRIPRHESRTLIRVALLLNGLCLMFSLPVIGTGWPPVIPG